MFWSLLFGFGDNYEPTEQEKEFDRLLNKCDELKKTVENKRALGYDATADMKEWKRTLLQLNSLNQPAQP